VRAARRSGSARGGPEHERGDIAPVRAAAPRPKRPVRAGAAERAWATYAEDLALLRVCPAGRSTMPDSAMMQSSIRYLEAISRRAQSVRAAANACCPGPRAGTASGHALAIILSLSTPCSARLIPTRSGIDAIVKLRRGDAGHPATAAVGDRDEFSRRTHRSRCCAWMTPGSRSSRRADHPCRRGDQCTRAQRP